MSFFHLEKMASLGSWLCCDFKSGEVEFKENAVKLSFWREMFSYGTGFLEAAW